MSEETKIKELQIEIATTFEELKKRNDMAIQEAEKRGGVATAETTAAVDKANNEITELRKQVIELEKQLQRPAIQQQRDGDKDTETLFRDKAFEKLLRYGAGETGRAMFTPEETRALGGTSDADGGFLIPASFESGIIMKAFNLAALRPVCQVGKTSRDVVKLGALSQPTVAWGRRNIAVTAQDLTTGGASITIFDLKALTLIHNNTLDDTDANIIQEMTDGFSKAIAAAEDTAFAVGVGDDSPKGIVADSAVQAIYAASGVAAALTDSTHNGIDALISCMYKPKSLYRMNGKWAFNSTTEAVIRKCKDSDGQYLWQPTVAAGVPNTLLGKPIVNPESMPDIGAGTFPIVFGDFSAGYKIRDRAGMTVQRLVERYAEYDQTGFIIKKRVGGQVVLAEAFACVKIAAS